MKAILVLAIVVVLSGVIAAQTPEAMAIRSHADSQQWSRHLVDHYLTAEIAKLFAPKAQGAEASSCCLNACNDHYRFCVAGCVGPDAQACKDQCDVEWFDCVDSTQ